MCQLFDDVYLESFNWNWGWVREFFFLKKDNRSSAVKVGTDTMHRLIGDQGLHRALLSK